MRKRLNAYHGSWLTRMVTLGMFALITAGSVTGWADFEMAKPASSLGTTSTTLLASSFSAGTGGMPMVSSSYSMVAAVGEAGLVSNQATISSANYRHQPGFLASGPSSKSAGARVFLPSVLRNFMSYFEGPFEQEDNDTFGQANGPLRSGSDYAGYPDDANDYFFFWASGAGTISVNVTTLTGQGSQLQLFFEDSANMVAFRASPPYQISYEGTSQGRYYVRVYTDSGHNTQTAYGLRVTYP